ncbi:ubiquitin-activating enzyme e1 [Anaeramoeba flamelloides]|uniref:Ubiquitin-activating enzyme e1 n=1 Tax=Anaeramoeba flamelloides TaxID=1746091 RepID=A0AAV7ZGK8_9EUKA|nr:ubiquitin-activating enzyme e1 [Anaeramoeba flamelloides]
MTENTNYFKKQKLIPNWPQEVVEEQVGFVLGVGGLGCTIAVALCRLGFKKIFILDFDVVDDHNLNRQILFSKKHINKSKIDSAMEALESHNLRTEIVPMEMEALGNWSKIVKAARECTVIFNLIDVGAYWDVAVQSLGLSLGIPVVVGGTFNQMMSFDFYPPEGAPCICCVDKLKDQEVLDRLLPDKIQGLENINFIPKDKNPVGASAVYVATVCGFMMVSTYMQYLQGNRKIPTRMIFYYNTYEWVSWPLEADLHCKFCSKSLYFDKRPCYYEKASGKTLVPKKFKSLNSKEEIEETKFRTKNPLVKLGEKYSKQIIPCIPSTDSKATEFGNIKDLPTSLQSPYIKCKKRTPYVGFASGIRSGVMLIGKKMYRFKGCGNNTERFLVRDVKVFGETKYEEVRGCMFEHTSLREYQMVSELSELMKKKGIPTANIPTAIFKYELEEDQLPKIGKFCNVYECTSDIRLANAVLPGLEGLLSVLVHDWDHTQYLSLFDKSRFDKDNKLINTAVAVNKKLPLIDLRKVNVLHEAPKPPKHEDVHPRWFKLWESESHKMAPIVEYIKKEKKSVGSIISNLYYKLGYEVGRVVMILEKEEISWGTFYDNFTFDFHCNAHPDNLILVSEKDSVNGNLLAPWDFDFAFTKESSVPNFIDEETWTNWKNIEKKEMKYAIAGQQNFDFGFKEIELSDEMKQLKIGLRDTITLGYLAAINGEEPPETDPEIVKGFYPMLNLALIMNKVMKD